MTGPEREEALELPDREAMSLLSTTPTLPLDGYEGVAGDPAATTGGAQDSASSASDLATADASATEQGSTTTEDRSETYSSTDTASAQT